MHPKTARNPRGAGRPPKYRTEAERRAARSVINKRYEKKARQGRVRVVTYVESEQAAQLQTIMEREGLPSMASAVRWMLERCAGCSRDER